MELWYHLCLTLSIIRYGSRVKRCNPGNGVAPSPTPWCSSYRKGSPSTMVANFTYINTYIFICIYTLLFTDTHIYLYIYIYIHSYLQTQIFIYVHTYIYIYIYIYIHTHTHTHKNFIDLIRKNVNTWKWIGPQGHLFSKLFLFFFNTCFFGIFTSGRLCLMLLLSLIYIVVTVFNEVIILFNFRICVWEFSGCVNVLSWLIYSHTHTHTPHIYIYIYIYIIYIYIYIYIIWKC